MYKRQGVDYLVLNNINNNAIAEIIERGKEEDVTLIFANTNSPTDEEFAMYDKVYHVSSVATQSGTIMGEALVKYWNEHPEMDRNGNGKLDYIMLLGIQGHYDTEVRSSYSLQALADAGIETECVQETICNYQRADAQNQVASILQARKDDVDAVTVSYTHLADGGGRGVPSPPPRRQRADRTGRRRGTNTPASAPLGKNAERHGSGRSGFSK